MPHHRIRNAMLITILVDSMAKVPQLSNSFSAARKPVAQRNIAAKQLRFADKMLG